jgi:hypothetical protein
MTTDNFFYLQNRLIQTSQTGGQRYSDTSPFSIPRTYTLAYLPVASPSPTPKKPFYNCRSLDSGRASNSNSNSNSTTDSFHSIHPIREHPYPVRGNSLGPPPPVSHIGRMSSVGSSFRQSYHSSSSSLGSVERGEDIICALDIHEMIADGVPVIILLI